MSGVRRRVLVKIGLLVVSALVAVSLVELTLKLGGSPTERGIQVSHPPNFRETRRHLEYEYEFITNSLGLRNPEISTVKPAGTKRILLAGDSFVEGMGVNEDSTISTFLQRELTGSAHLEIINGGLQGTGALEHGRLARLIGYELDLDGLLFFVFDNDVPEARPSQRPEDMARRDSAERSGIKAAAHDLLPRTYTASSRAWARLRRLADRGDVVDTIVSEARDRGIAESRIEAWRANVLPEYGEAMRKGTIAIPIFSMSLVSPHYWRGAIDLDAPGMEEGFSTMTELLSASIDDARSRGIEVGVVYIPSKFQFDPSAHSAGDPWVLAGADIRTSWLSGKTAIRERLEAWASRIGVEYLDLTPSYREAVARGERLTWNLDEHFNAKGNQHTAVVIANWLRQCPGFGALLE